MIETQTTIGRPSFVRSVINLRADPSSRKEFSPPKNVRLVMHSSRHRRRITGSQCKYVDRFDEFSRYDDGTAEIWI